MAKKVLKKSFGLASLFMSALLCVLGGITFLKNIKANATELTQTEPTSLISADSGAIVSYDGGVKVSSEEAYEGQINHTFAGDTTLKFIFAQPHEGWFAGNFVFRVTDAVDETKYFDVEYKVVHFWTSTTYTRIGYTNAFVKYGSQVRTAKQSGATWYNKEVTGDAAGNNSVLSSPSMTINAYAPRTGILKLGYDDQGHFAVTVSNQTNDNSRTIAAFDGTNDFVDQTSWGLPEMPFANGYTISFSSEFESSQTTDKATDVLFKSIQNGDTTYTLTGNTNTETITVAERVGYEKVKVGSTVAIPNATYASETPVENVQIVKPNGEKEALTMGGNYVVEQEGLHTVVYTTNAGSVAAYSFNAVAYLKATDFVYTQATVSQTTAGLKVASETPYKGRLKGVFTGETTLEFIFAQQHEGWFAGNFVFRITDAVDETKYFDVEYKAVHRWESGTYTEIGDTNAVVKYGDEVRTAKQSGATWYNKEVMGAAAGQNNVLSSPSMTINGYSKNVGILKLGYDAQGHFAVTVSNQTNDNSRTIAAFDGTNDFVDQTSWGLPEMPFANGYTISFSSEFESEETTDRATDVLFKTIENGIATYDFTANSEMEKDVIITGFEKSFELLGAYEESLPAGKVFLGWKNTQTGKLYPANDYARKNEDETLEALVVSFDTLTGASVRIDTSENGQSGIRFTTVFDMEEYTQISSYIQSMGTIVAYTDTLTSAGLEFLPENYEVGSTIAKVENTKGTYEYFDNVTQKSYTAYSMAIVGIKDYAKAFSARAYLVVEYADGSTQTIYSDYNQTDNSRSIAHVAYLVKTVTVDKYNAMSTAQKAIIDEYSAEYAE